MVTDTSSLAHCAYRRVYRGQTHCTRATDEFDRLVWSEVCARCPVPGWLDAGICRHLDIGTEVGKNLVAKTPRVYAACRFFGVRLDGLERCSTCPEFSRWEGEGIEDDASEGQRLVRSIPRELIEHAVQQAVDQHVQEVSLGLMPRCFRAGVDHCIRSPQFLPDLILALPPSSLRQNEGYRMLVAEVLKNGKRKGFFFTGSLKDVDSLCDLCLSVQQCSHLVVDLSEWDKAALFAMGLARALGREILMIRGQDPTPPFVPQGLPVFEYSTGESLAMLLVQGLNLSLPPAPEGLTEEASQARTEGEQETNEEEGLEKPEQKPRPKKTPRSQRTKK